MNDGGDVGPGAIDFAVNEAFEIDRAPIRPHDRAVGVEFQDVRRLHQGRRHVAGEPKAIRTFGAAGAHMTEAVEHVLVEQDVIGVDEVIDQA